MLTKDDVSSEGEDNLNFNIILIQYTHTYLSHSALLIALLEIYKEVSNVPLPNWVETNALSFLCCRQIYVF